VCRYNLIVIEYELFPYFPSFFEKLLAFFHIKFIVDYDDAIFHNYDNSSNKVIRYLLGTKIDRVMKYSSCVIVGNSYLENRAFNAKASCIKIIPTIIDQRRYKQKETFSTDKFKIGWIGSPTTFNYLKSIKKSLQQFGHGKKIEIHIVGSNESLDFENINEIHYEWNENTEAITILNFDIGIMPLEDTPWAKGKCAYKLIQYMACGIPVLATPVGMNKKIIKNGVNGFLAKTEEEWISALNTLYKNPELQKKMGKNGRQMIDEFYNLEYQSNKYIEIIKLITKS
jgi:glycosyltransferase involved in cell wall biosynthesis